MITGLWLRWLWLQPRWGSLGLATVSLLPLAVSSEALAESTGGVDMIYGLIQCSPVYGWLRLTADPWQSSFIYADSPFHFGPESHHLLMVMFFHVVVQSLGVVQSWRAKG